MKNQIKHEINEQLLKKWDPIGIGSTLGAEDEYLQYVPTIYQIIAHSSSYINLFEHLWKIETEYMGLKGNRNKTDGFANALFSRVKEMIDA